MVQCVTLPIMRFLVFIPVAILAIVGCSREPIPSTASDSFESDGECGHGTIRCDLGTFQTCFQGVCAQGENCVDPFGPEGAHCE